MVTVEEYRKLLNDYRSTEKQVLEKIGFIEKICRNIIRDEVKAYVAIKRISGN